MLTTHLQDASIYKRKSGYTLKWPDYFERKDRIFLTLQEAKSHYYIQLAWDYLGVEIRDNSKKEKIQLGKDIEKYGIDIESIN